MKFSARTKLILTLGSSVLGAAAFAFLFWYLSSGILLARAGIEEEKTKTQQFDRDVAETRSAKILLENRAADSARIDSFFIDPESPVGFVEELESLGKALHSAVTIDVDDSNKKNGELAFRLAAEGTQERVLAYIQALEQMPYKIYVRDLAFDAIPAGESTSPAAVKGGGMPTARASVLITVKTR